MRRKMNNKGLTLIEVLVTIAIIAIVSIPFLNTFTAGMRVNNEARITADAEQTAKDVAETFQTMSLEDIVKNYGGTGNNTYVENFTTFTSQNQYGDELQGDNHYVLGDAKEKFFITAELTADPSENAAYDFFANIAKTPVFSNISDDSTIMIYDKYKKNDNAVTAADATADKYTVFNIQCAYVAATPAEVAAGEEDSYTISITMDTYVNSKSGTKVGDTIFIKSESVKATDELPYIYIIPVMFDRTDSALTNKKSGDKIEFNYSYTGDEDKEKVVRIFLMQQKTYALNDNGTVSTDLIALNQENIYFNFSCNGVAKNADVHKIPFKQNMILYSNITDFGKKYRDSVTGTSYNSATGVPTFNELTGNTKSVNYIYQLKVTVRKDAPDGETVATLLTSLTK